MELRRVQEQRASLHALRLERGEFGEEVREQRGRLLSLQLLPSVTTSATCPVCESALDEDDQTTAALRQGAVELKSRLAGVRSLEPERRRAVAALREEQLVLRRQIRAVQESLTNLAVEDPRLASLQDSERRAYTRGRVTQFLEALAPTEEVRLRLIEEHLEQLNAEIERLAAAVDPAAVAGRMASALSFINDWMSESARRLGLEYNRIRLDTESLAVVADRRRGELPLARIGSAANHVGYHIAAHTALHRWFVEEDRPVPRFLFLDQPEQAYFPEHVPADARDPSEEILDEDWENVRAMYLFLRDAASALDGKLQLIVVGHARFDEFDWFPTVLVEDWKSAEKGLVPWEWMEDAADEAG